MREEEEQEEEVEGRGGERNERLQFGPYAYHFISYGSLKVTDSSFQ